MILVVVGALGTVTKGLVKGRVETIQTTAVLRSARIFRRALKI